MITASMVPKTWLPESTVTECQKFKRNRGRISGSKTWNQIASSKERRPGLSKTPEFPTNFIHFRTTLEDVFAVILPDSSIEHCNYVLRMLERSDNDDKTLAFFEWMRMHNKLKNNTHPYSLALRTFARKEGWNAAMILIDEMSSSGLRLSSSMFNSLIYVCAKRGIVNWGAKWFHLMLEKEVQPDVATIGMLMGLFQKSGDLLEAEYTFGCMRRFKLYSVNAYSAMITIYTRLGLHSKSAEIVCLMEEDHVLPNLENWLVQLNAHSQQGNMEKAESVFKSMVAAGFSPNIVAFNTLITGCGKISDIESAKSVFRRLYSMGLKPDETTYRSMVEGCGQADCYADALYFYNELKKSGFEPCSSNFHTMINLQSRHKDDTGILQTIRDMTAVGCHHSSILSSLLSAYERVGRIGEVSDILKSSVYETVLMDPASSSILVLRFARNLLLDDALQVLKDKKWEDSKFEDNLYHLLLCSCKEAGDYEESVKVYNQMPKCETNPNLHITCSMIDIYSAMHRFSDAEKLFVLLKTSGTTLDVVAYTVSVRMYVKAESLEEACGVLEVMEEKDVTPDVFLFRDMLRVYQRCGRLDKLASTYYWILKSGVAWDEAMYNCVINCCSRVVPVDELSRLFDAMCQQGFAANSVTFNVLLDAYGNAGLVKKATEVFWMARKLGLTDPISYNTIISACGRNKKLHRMKYFARQMEFAGYPVSVEAYNCMLDAYGKEDRLEDFREVLEKMEDAGCGLNHYTYNIMINIYGKKGWIEEVAGVLAELRDRGMELDMYSYNSLIKAYGIAGMTDEAVGVVQEMRSKGLEPDRVTFKTLISALQRNEEFLESVKWSLWMKQMGI